MGPNTLFDKCFLQSLTVDESVWFDRFFSTVVCPIFYVETLADLKKSVRKGRTPEQEVGIIADKFPNMHGTPSIFHLTLAMNNLLGSHFPLRGQIPVSGGRPVKAGGKSGIVCSEFPENEAFSRWSERQFYEVEHQYASFWRANLTNLNLEAMAKGFKELGINGKACKTLEEAKKLAHTIVNDSDKPHMRMKLACDILHIYDDQARRKILEHWSVFNYPPLSTYAPYAAYVVTIEIFFRIAMAASLISPERASNYIDIAYLYYLPFCNIFVSSDKLHRKCAPLFMRPDQEFIWGIDLKTGLNHLDTYYKSSIPSEIMEKSIMEFAKNPPKDGQFFVSEIWDKHYIGWRNKKTNINLSESRNMERVSEARMMMEASQLSSEEIDFDLADPDTFTVRRAVQKRKGSWYQLPKNLEGD